MPTSLPRGGARRARHLREPLAVHAPGVAFVDGAAVLARQELDAVDEGLGVVVPLAGARVVSGSCARALGAEQAAVRPHYLEQQLQGLRVVEAGVVVEVLHVAVEGLLPVRAA